MKNEDRIVELLAELVKESQETRSEISDMKNGISDMKSEVSDMKSEISGMRQDIVSLQKSQVKMEKNIARNTAAIGELRLSVIKLSENLEMVVEHERRLGKLESAVFKN